MSAGATYPYQDAGLAVEQRVEDLIARMTVQDKAALMFQQIAGLGALNEPHPLTRTPALLDMLTLGMTHFNVAESPKDGRRFAEWSNDLQRRALERPLGIPITFSSDPRHHFGDNPLTQLFAGPYSQWPETLGLAALRSPERVRRFADIARQEYIAAGIRVALHPQVDLATEPRWSRINTTFGEDADLTSELVAAYIRGFQGPELGPESVSTMTKHFPGGGPQRDGDDAHFSWGREQVYPGHNFDYHLKPFRAALAAGGRQIMPYYGMPVGTEHEEVGFGFNRSVITGILRNELGFDGIVCTDWQLITENSAAGEDGHPRAWGVEDLSPEQRIIKVLDAGADQFGGEHCVELLVGLVNRGAVPESRLDVSARRLLREKFELGLFDAPFVNEDRAAITIGREDFMAEGRKAQQDSVTLLTNTQVDGHPVLPLEPGIRLYAEGLEPDAIDGRADLVDSPDQADVAVLRLQAPFVPSERQGLAEMFHHGSLEFAPAELARIRQICRTVPTVVAVYLDRPAVLGAIADDAGALLVDYGIAPDALAEVLFGVAEPHGKLPFDLPRSDAAVAASRTDVPFDTEDPVFSFGYGLEYGASE